MQEKLTTFLLDEEDIVGPDSLDDIIRHEIIHCLPEKVL